MIVAIPGFVERQAFRLLARSGMYSSGGGINPGEGTLVEVLLFIILGAFLGLLSGLMIAQLVRFFSMYGTRQISGMSWTIYGTLLGILLFGFLAVTRKGED
jgi:hypothetical protein